MKMNNIRIYSFQFSNKLFGYTSRRKAVPIPQPSSQNMTFHIPIISYTDKSRLTISSYPTVSNVTLHPITNGSSTDFFCNTSGTASIHGSI